MNPYELWERKHLTSIREVIGVFEEDAPVVCGADTETTGLHIKKDKAFLIIFGWLIPGGAGRVYTFYPTPDNMKIFFHLAKKCKLFIFHNCKFDCHMMTNAGYEYDGDNLCENMALARASVEAIPARNGGDSLALKALGIKYVHWKAGDSEKLVKEELRKLNVERIRVLSQALKQFPIEGEFTASGKQKYWGKGAIESFLKDPTQDADDLPEGVRDVWLDWQEEYPEPTYADVDRDLMIQYASEDVITMLEYARKAMRVVTEREQWDIVKHEMKLIMPLYRMERAGIKVDREYLLKSRKIMKDYITKQRNKMYEIAGEKVNVGQDKTIIQVFKKNWDIDMENCDKKALKYIAKTYEGEPVRYAKLIMELRTLEKWYSTYLNRILSTTEYDGRFYTQIAQCSAVSGRVGSDSQQFPKDGIFDEDGNELFIPRKAFIPSDQGKDEGYTSIWYCDLSQVELRVQANYTLLVSGGDLNLCRAFFPFKCRHEVTGELFDIKKDMAEWDSGQWLDENGKQWTPTDVHSETTARAFPHIPLGTDEFKKWRSKGKIFNFLANYGGGKGAAIASLDLKEEEADALVKGYAEAFPHVRIYQEAVQKQHAKNGYVTNMYGRRYYIKDNRKAYKLANYLVQGSCADDMKRSIIEIDKLIASYKTKMILTVHDEIQFEIWKGEEHLIPKILKIMGDVEWSLVPITCDAEVTYTDWYEKREIKI